MKPASPALLNALNSARKLTLEQVRRALDREIVKRHMSPTPTTPKAEQYPLASPMLTPSEIGRLRQKQRDQFDLARKAFSKG